MKRQDMVSKIADIIQTYREMKGSITSAEIADKILAMQKEEGMLPPAYPRYDHPLCDIFLTNKWEE